MNKFPRVPTLLYACFGLLLGSSAGWSAETSLEWGAEGSGGSGAWNTVNWWNGTALMSWQPGAHAVFGGTGGVVTSFTFGPQVASMTFNSPGYVVKDGWISTAASFKITANADVTISSVLSSNSIGSILRKSGPGTLTVSGTNFIDSVYIDEGSYRIEGTSSLFFSDVIIANSASAGLILAPTYQDTLVGSLSGGGFVQPEDKPGTVSLRIFGTGSFDGAIRNNGAAKLALEIVGTQILSNVNSYTGKTSVPGKLTLSQGGTILNSSDVRVLGLGVLSLDNSAAATNRISDAAEVRLSNGELQLLGNQTLAVDEIVGSLVIDRPSRIKITSAGAETLLTFSNFTRERSATLNLLSDGVKLGDVAVGPSGIISPAITRENDWATLGVDGRVKTYAGYTSDLNSGGASDNVKITSAATTLANPTAKSTLNLQNGSAELQTLNLNSNTLELTGGGILSSGTSATRIEGGRILSAAGELIVTARNNLTIDAEIAGVTTSLTKSGAGTVTLTGTNTYTGITSIVEGNLVVSKDANLGLGPSVSLEGGTLRASASFSSEKGITGSGIINTNSNDVRFTGKVTGSISKHGAGRLTLSDYDGTLASVREGTLVLPSVEAGEVILDGGKLEASGKISGLTFNQASTVDIQSFQIATLEVGSLNSASSANQISTFVFDLQSMLSDLLFLEHPSQLANSSSSNGLFISFRNLGDVSVGIDYTIMEFGAPYYLSPLPFAVSPESLALGWVGLFTQTENGVSIRFSSVGAPVPEPSALLLMLLGLPLAWILLGRQVSS